MLMITNLKRGRQVKNIFQTLQTFRFSIFKEGSAGNQGNTTKYNNSTQSSKLFKDNKQKGLKFDSLKDGKVQTTNIEKQVNNSEQVQTNKFEELVDNISEQQSEAFDSEHQKSLDTFNPNLTLPYQSLIAIANKISKLDPKYQKQCLQQFLNMIKHNAGTYSYFQVKNFIANFILIYKFPLHEADMITYDTLLSTAMSKSQGQVVNDYVALLHTMILINKEIPQELKQFFKKSQTVILQLLSKLNKQKYLNLNEDKKVKEEFERIVQYLSLIGLQVSSNGDLIQLHLNALAQIFIYMKKINIQTLNSRMLTFFISSYGKNCVLDEQVNLLKQRIFQEYNAGKASLLDIVETLNSLMIVNKLTEEDLKEINLLRNHVFAKEIANSAKKFIGFRYYEILASAEITNIGIWGSFLASLSLIDLNTLGQQDNNQILGCLDFILLEDSLAPLHQPAEIQLQKQAHIKLDQSSKQANGNKQNAESEKMLFTALQKLDKDTQAQFKIPRSSYVSDFYSPSTNILIELNGPTHQIKLFDGEKITETKESNGRTKHKVNILNKKGFKVLTLRHDDFYGKDSQAVESFLKEQLKI